MPKKVSVIIPCYNQGLYLQEAVQSLSACDPEHFETIIVDDGSTDPATLDYFHQLENEGMHIIHQLNQGLSAARNTGIRAAEGELMIMLDADNKIYPAFIELGIQAMDQHPEAGVVYGNAEFFGDQTGLRKQEPFNLQKQLLVNHIDAGAMIRKKAFEMAGYYDENMREGWEDWELWLRFAFKGIGFVYVDEIFYAYRIRKDSMSKGIYDNIAKTNRVENYVFEKYRDKMGIHHVTDFLVDRFRRRPFHFLAKLLIRSYFPSYYAKLLKENKIRNGL